MPRVSLAHDDVGSGPAVVLVHGHPFDRSMWRGQVPGLGGEFRVVAPDLRGYGLSPALGDVARMSDLAGDVWGLLGDLGVGDFAVVGLSMGGLVAMELAIADPQRVWALGLVATTAEPVTEDERRARHAMAAEVQARGMDPLVQSMAPRLFGLDPDPQLVAAVTAMMAGNNPRGAAAALRGRAERPDYRAGLRALRIPSWVCVGTRDTWSTAAVTRELVSCLANPRVLTLPEVGHLPNLEAPARFDRELLDFLCSARPPGAAGG
jgi:3-oxoadipate enol-lactonase